MKNSINFALIHVYVNFRDMWVLLHLDSFPFSVEVGNWECLYVLHYLFVTEKSIYKPSCLSAPVHYPAGLLISHQVPQLICGGALQDLV